MRSSDARRSARAGTSVDSISSFAPISFASSGNRAPTVAGPPSTAPCMNSSTIACSSTENVRASASSIDTIGARFPVREFTTATRIGAAKRCASSSVSPQIVVTAHIAYGSRNRVLGSKFFR